MDSFTQLDGKLLIGIQHALDADWLTSAARFVTLFGEGGIFLIILCIVLMIFRRTRRLGIICAISLAFTFICCNLVIKPAVDRPRPWELFAAVNALVPDPGDASFPSGHSANSMAVAWALFINTLPPRTAARKVWNDTPCLGWKGVGADPAKMHAFGIAMVILAVLIGLSRLILGMHFPSDVICGLFLGIICSSIVHFVIKKIESDRGIIGAEKV